MTLDNLTPGLWCLNRRAEQGDPYAVALRAEFARLYDAAGERRPDALGLPRIWNDAPYTYEAVQEWTAERGE